MIAYPNFSKKIVIHTDASDYQLGAAIAQEDTPISFFSRKINKVQPNYTTTEKELLSIVETLKKSRTISLGYKIEVHTNHKNLVHETTLMASDRLMRWRLIIEMYIPEIYYILGLENIVVHAMGRTPMIDDNIKDKQL